MSNHEELLARLDFSEHCGPSDGLPSMLDIMAKDCKDAAAAIRELRAAALAEGGAREAVALPYVVEYARKDGGHGWIPMAAFDQESVADNYATKCGEGDPPWEYRVVSAAPPAPDADGERLAALTAERDRLREEVAHLSQYSDTQFLAKVNAMERATEAEAKLREVEAATIERCAKVCNKWLSESYNNETHVVVSDVAYAIRALAPAQSGRGECEPASPPLPGLEQEVDFYEHEFYPLSNFSSFKLNWAGHDFDTSEHAYHWEKFKGMSTIHQNHIRFCRSAHDAFKYAEQHKDERRADWDAVKVSIMRDILRAKAEQHEYVRRKLLETGTRMLVECSWRDDFWGWGPNKDGKNMLGKLWMEIRAEISRLKGSGE